MRYISVMDYAIKWGLHPNTVQRALRAGKLPGAVKNGGKWVIPDNALIGGGYVDDYPVQVSRHPEPVRRPERVSVDQLSDEWKRRTRLEVEDGMEVDEDEVEVEDEPEVDDEADTESDTEDENEAEDGDEVDAEDTETDDEVEDDEVEADDEVDTEPEYEDADMDDEDVDDESEVEDETEEEVDTETEKDNEEVDMETATGTARWNDTTIERENELRAFEAELKALSTMLKDEQASIEMERQRLDGFSRALSDWVAEATDKAASISELVLDLKDGHYEEQVPVGGSSYRTVPCRLPYTKAQINSLLERISGALADLCELKPPCLDDYGMDSDVEQDGEDEDVQVQDDDSEDGDESYDDSELEQDDTVDDDA